MGKQLLLAHQRSASAAVTLVFSAQAKDTNENESKKEDDEEGNADAASRLRPVPVSVKEHPAVNVVPQSGRVDNPVTAHCGSYTGDDAAGGRAVTHAAVDAVALSVPLTLSLTSPFPQTHFSMSSNELAEGAL